MRIIKTIRDFYTIRIVEPFRQIFKLGAEIALELGSGLIDKNKIKIFSFLCFLQHRIRFPRKIKTSVKIKFLDKNFRITLSNRADLGVIKDVFSFKHYEIDAVNPEIIVDLGSNIGMSVLYFKARYPQAKIFAIEVHPYIFQRLRKNVPNDVVCLNMAITGHNGKERFYINKKHSSSSLIVPSSEFVDVNCMTLDSFMEEYKLSKINILKFDIEGAEYEAFKNFRNLNKVEYAIGEVHLDMFKRPFDDFSAFFNRFDLLFKKDDIVAFKNMNIVK